MPYLSSRRYFRFSEEMVSGVTKVHSKVEWSCVWERLVVFMSNDSATLCVSMAQFDYQTKGAWTLRLYFEVSPVVGQ